MDLRAGDGAARVTLDYEVRGAQPGTTLPAELLLFPGTEVDSLSVGAAAAPTALRHGAGVTRLAELPVGGDAPAAVRVRYRVAGAARVQGGAVIGRVPLLALDRPPGDAAPGLFRARLLVPDGWALAEGFPTGMRVAEGAPAVWEATLPVVPAVVRFRARTDGAWRPGMPLLLDAVALLGLVAFSVLGWRHMRAEAAA